MSGRQRKIMNGHNKKGMLTGKQEKFVQELVKGKSQRQAYRIAYPSSVKWKDASVDQKASTLFANVKVKSRYDELQSKIEQKVTHDAAEVRDIIINTMLSIVNADVMNDDVDGRAVKNKHYDRNGRMVYDHYDKIEASKMLIGLLGIENAGNDNSINIHLHSSEEYDG